MTRVCKKCGVEKELNADNFRPHDGPIAGFRYECRECIRTKRQLRYLDDPEKERARAKAWNTANAERRSASTKAWRKANPERYRATAAAHRRANRARYAVHQKRWVAKNPDKHRSQVLRTAYGIDLDRYNLLLETQGGGCAICGDTTADSAGRNLHVDHCHTTERVRGLLCSSCNSILGRAKDNPTILERAAQYLLSH